jgi:hypothetical protein
MSHSKARTYRYCNIIPGMKRRANKVVRRKKDIPDGSFYRRLFQSWNICDDRPHLIDFDTDWGIEISRK